MAMHALPYEWLSSQKEVEETCVAHAAVHAACALYSELKRELPNDGTGSAVSN